MNEPLPTYNGRLRANTNRPRQLAPLPLKAHKLALRISQLAKEPGEYEFTLTVSKDGRWQLKPPSPVEDLGL